MAKRTVLLVSANTERLPLPAYPLALPRLAAALESAGFRAVQYDLLCGSLPGLQEALRREKPGLVGLSLRNIDNLDSGSLKSYVPGYRRLAAAVRAASKAPLVLGGSGFSIFPGELMKLLGADYGIAGRGEELLCRLAADVFSGRGPAPAARLHLRGAAACGSAPPPPPRHLPPAHERELLLNYWRGAGLVGAQFRAGCPRACVYCTYPLLEGRAAAGPSPRQVAEELARLRRGFGIRYVFLVDSVFNQRQDEELELAAELAKRCPGLRWGAYFSPHKAGYKYLAALKRSGLSHVHFGSDSFSDPVLESYGKGFTYADVRRSADAAFAAGLPAAQFLIFGGPGETRATVRETFARAREHRRTVFFTALGMRVYPGTALAALASRGPRPVRAGLKPAYYFAPGFDHASLERLVQREAAGAPNWLLPRDEVKSAEAVSRLRRAGLDGPLWEYLCR